MKLKEKTPASKLSYVQKIKSIAANRQHGDARVVAKTVGYHETTVSEVLRGRYRNDVIVNEFYNMLYSRKNGKK
jgi:hypothetical protein